MPTPFPNRLNHQAKNQRKPGTLQEELYTLIDRNPNTTYPLVALTALHLILFIHHKINYLIYYLTYYLVVDGKYKRKCNLSNKWVCYTDES